MKDVRDTEQTRRDRDTIKERIVERKGETTRGGGSYFNIKQHWGNLAFLLELHLHLSKQE